MFLFLKATVESMILCSIYVNGFHSLIKMETGTRSENENKTQNPDFSPLIIWNIANGVTQDTCSTSTITRPQGSWED